MIFTKGQRVYLEVGKITKNSFYTGYPVYRIFEVIDPLKTKTVNDSGFRAVSAQLYWNPIVKESPKKWIPYKTDDEFGLYLRSDYPDLVTSPMTLSLLATPSANQGTIPIKTTTTGTYDDLGPGSFFRFDSPSGNVGIYKSTEQTVPFNLLKYIDSNPYKTSSIRVWIKTSAPGTSRETGVTYWYHPSKKHMYVIPVYFDPETARRDRSGRPSISGLDQGEFFIDSIRQGKILALLADGLSLEQAIARVDRIIRPDTPSRSGAQNQESGQGTSSAAEVAVVTRIRGNYGFVSGVEPEGNDPQIVQYYSSDRSVQPSVSRHFFRPKPNEISYDNLGSEWTEIERAGRVPMIDWKNFKLMKISFSFLVLPDDTYRTGAFGQTADEGITLSIDDKLEQLRNMASRPFPVTLFGFDGLITNPNPYSFSEGSGVQFTISDLRISSMMRTPNGKINRATCEISLQELPLEYTKIIALPKLQIRSEPGTPTTPATELGEKNRKATQRLGEIK
jgi:hypothetical protein